MNKPNKTKAEPYIVQGREVDMTPYEWRKPTAEQRQWIMNMQRAKQLLLLRTIECTYMGKRCTAATLANPIAKTLEIRLHCSRDKWPEGFPLWPEDPSELGHGPLVDEARARIEAGEFDTRKLGLAEGEAKKLNAEWIYTPTNPLPSATELMEARAKQEAEAKAEKLERLRDEFAKECMGSLSLHRYTPEQAGELSYRYADAMLKAREGK